MSEPRFLITCAGDGADVDAILEMNRHPDFGGDEKVRWYLREEVEEWVRDRANNIVLIVYNYEEGSDKVERVGFLFAKRISCAWAYLDGLFVRPEYRGRNLGHSLLTTFENILRDRGAWYFSAVVAADKERLVGWVRKFGCKSGGAHVWFEKEF